MLLAPDAPFQVVKVVFGVMRYEVMPSFVVELTASIVPEPEPEK